eukprot:TRINITY_DN1148_c0_g1_i1.p1 TRINITY_DN1148_c0_g1~~TRINITY_DN1148_c0_g1_i1.p1  ORF type:complete len:193 (-),score=46.33 TRINITY_DN1148_c0_g1_i1:28-606(-)
MSGGIGWIQKKGNSGISLIDAWQRRWFHLKGGSLCYYLDQLELHPKGRIDLKDVRAANVVRQTEYFDLETMTRTYHLRAETWDEAKAWCSTINLAKWECDQSRRSKDAEANHQIGITQPQPQQTNAPSAPQQSPQQQYSQGYNPSTQYESSNQPSYESSNQSQENTSQWEQQPSAPSLYPDLAGYNIYNNNK